MSEQRKNRYPLRFSTSGTDTEFSGFASDLSTLNAGKRKFRDFIDLTDDDDDDCVMSNPPRVALREIKREKFGENCKTYQSMSNESLNTSFLRSQANILSLQSPARSSSHSELSNSSSPKVLCRRLEPDLIQKYTGKILPLPCSQNKKHTNLSLNKTNNLGSNENNHVSLAECSLEKKTNKNVSQKLSKSNLRTYLNNFPGKEKILPQKSYRTLEEMSTNIDASDADNEGSCVENFHLKAYSDTSSVTSSPKVIVKRLSDKEVEQHRKKIKVDLPILSKRPTKNSQLFRPNTIEESSSESDSSSDFSSDDDGGSKDGPNEMPHCNKKQKKNFNSSYIKNTDKGRLVWAKIGKNRPWPAVIINPKDCGINTSLTPETAWVFWFGDNRVSPVKLSKTLDFPKSFTSLYVSTITDKNYKVAVKECIRECCKLGKIEDVDVNSFESLLKFAKEGFPNALGSLDAYYPSSGKFLFYKVVLYL